MSRSRILTSIAATALGIALFGACSAESLTERAVGFGLEQAIEGDQDIDLDFSDDGTGGFSISTDEGDFAINFDEDSGGIVFNTDEGDGVISFDEDGIVYDTDEGDGVISFDQDNDGAVTFTTDDGEVSFFDTSDIPDSWPSEIGIPATLVAGSQAFSVFDMGAEGAMTTGVFEHAPNDPYASQVAASLEANGWNTDLNSSDGSGLFAMFSKGENIVQVIGDGTTTTISFIAGTS